MNDADVSPFDRIRATFRPTRPDTLRPEARAVVGLRGLFRALWPIEDGPYTGQWAWTWEDRDVPGTPYIGWLPSCDLAEVVKIEEMVLRY